MQEISLHKIDNHFQDNHLVQVWINNKPVNEEPRYAREIQDEYGSVKAWILKRASSRGGGYGVIELKKPNGHDTRRNGAPASYKQRKIYAIMEELKSDSPQHPETPLAGRPNALQPAPEPQEPRHQPNFDAAQLPKETFSRDAELMYHKNELKRLEDRVRYLEDVKKINEEKVGQMKEDAFELKREIQLKKDEIERIKRNNETINKVIESAGPGVVQQLPQILSSFMGGGKTNGQQQALSGAADAPRQRLLQVLEHHPDENVNALTSIAQIMGQENGEQFGQEVVALIHKYQNQPQNA